MVAQGQRLQKTDLSVKVSRIRGAVKSVAITWHVGINVLWQRHEISKLRFSTLELVSTSLGLHPFGILLVCQKLFLLGSALLALDLLHLGSLICCIVLDMEVHLF